ncbi:Uncharacterised protein [Vibrio cholerae]|nr:Uncharacterised protein [Vibrio cholerae]CSB39463.1 Uncharacterised protein [Vibrio cholerae]CSB48113.1 Uncharacterised protein [Vibrio cholerae]CSC45122.1 Uncharacterised protein [Vibrio cholerae]CSD26202.1 Uncharacterised protein [Vibrio cholerae]
MIKTVTEFGSEHLFNFRHRIMTIILLDQTNRFFHRFGHTRVGGHHKNHVTEIGFTAVVIRQRTVIHHL